MNNDIEQFKIIGRNIEKGISALIAARDSYQGLITKQEFEEIRWAIDRLAIKMYEPISK